MISLSRSGADLEKDHELCFRHVLLRVNRKSRKKLDSWIWTMGKKQDWK